MSIAQLISPQQLAERQQQPGLVILDCRFALEDTAYGQRSYANGHIEGSCFADLERDLSGPVSKGKTGRHPLPDAQTAGRAAILHGLDAMRDELLREFQIEVPVFPWPAPPQRLLRVSAQLYNSLPDYEKLASAVKVLLGKRETQSGLSRQCANLCAE